MNIIARAYTGVRDLCLCKDVLTGCTVKEVVKDTTTDEYAVYIVLESPEGALHTIVIKEA
jgi:hypothetical protein